MLRTLSRDPLSLATAQAGAAAVLALAMMAVARRHRIHLEREIVVAVLRGILQVVAVGSILVLLFRGPSWTSLLVLAAMLMTAASMAAGRVKKIHGAFGVALVGLVAGAGSVILLMTVLGVIGTGSAELVPVASMIIANAMNTGSLALERLRSDVEAHVGLIETGLALGAAPQSVVAPYVQTAVRASLIPGIDNMRSLGIVWIPGLMAGMILSGSDPVQAAVYQFVVIAMIFAASGLTAMLATLLVRGRIFTRADQLLLRPGFEEIG